MPTAELLAAELLAGGLLAGEVLAGGLLAAELAERVECVRPADEEVLGATVALATEIRARALGPDRGAVAARLSRALKLFHEVQEETSRFDPASPLTQANARPGEWWPVPDRCFLAVAEAFRSYVRTDGRFDPRIREESDPSPRELWRPGFRVESGTVRLGPLPVDLGGISRGLALRWASTMLEAVAPDHLLEAGGDCYCAGRGPDGEPWRIGVADPLERGGPVAVLALENRAVAAFSAPPASWRPGAAGAGRPGGCRGYGPVGKGLVKVCVVGADTADVQVWSRVLFLEGAVGVEALAAAHRLAAVWVTDEGEIGTTPEAEGYIVWRRPALVGGATRSGGG